MDHTTTNKLAKERYSLAYQRKQQKVTFFEDNALPHTVNATLDLMESHDPLTHATWCQSTTSCSHRWDMRSTLIRKKTLRNSSINHRLKPVIVFFFDAALHILSKRRKNVC